MTAPVQVSGGNYPLIQQPNPFQELADTINGLRAQRVAQQLQALQRQHLMAQIQNLGAQTQQTQAETGMIPARERALGAQADEALSLSHLHQTQDKEAQRTAEGEHETQLQTQMGMGPINVAIAHGIRPDSPKWSHIVGKALSRVDDPRAQLEISNRVGAYVRQFTEGQTSERQGAAQQETVRHNRATEALGWAGLKAAADRQQNRPLTKDERLAAVQVEGAKTSLQAMRDIVHRNPEAARVALRYINAQDAHVAGIPVGAITNYFRGAPQDQDARDFISHFANFQLVTTPAYGGRRPTVPLLGLERVADLPGAGQVSENDFNVPFGNMQQRLDELSGIARMPGGGATVGAPATVAPASGVPVTRNFNRFLGPTR